MKPIIYILLIAAFAFIFASCEQAPASPIAVSTATPIPTPTAQPAVKLEMLRLKVTVANWMTTMCIVNGNYNPDCGAEAFGCVKEVGLSGDTALDKLYECGALAQLKAKGK